MALAAYRAVGNRRQFPDWPINRLKVCDNKYIRVLEYLVKQAPLPVPEPSYVLDNPDKRHFRLWNPDTKEYSGNYNLARAGEGSDTWMSIIRKVMTRLDFSDGNPRTVRMMEWSRPGRVRVYRVFRDKKKILSELQGNGFSLHKYDDSCVFKRIELVTGGHVNRPWDSYMPIENRIEALRRTKPPGLEPEIRNVVGRERIDDRVASKYLFKGRMMFVPMPEDAAVLYIYLLDAYNKTWYDTLRRDYEHRKHPGHKQVLMNTGDRFELIYENAAKRVGRRAQEIHREPTFRHGENILNYIERRDLWEKDQEDRKKELLELSKHLPHSSWPGSNRRNYLCRKRYQRIQKVAHAKGI